MIVHSITTNFSYLSTMFYHKPDKPESLQDIHDLGLQQRPQEFPKEWPVGHFMEEFSRKPKC